MAALCAEVKERYHIAVSARFAERMSGAVGGVTAERVYQQALKENLKDITDVGTLPYGIASQANATIVSPVLLQVNRSRDVTQPLRPCADAIEEETTISWAFQKNTPKRLLRLVVSDGHTEIPAIELSTLRVFRTIPVPGEKLLFKEGTEVRNGAIIMTENSVVPVGGEVQQLKMELPVRQKNRTDAPRFQPLFFGGSAEAGGGNRTVANPDRSRGRGVGGGHGHRGGRGSRGHHHHQRRMDSGRGSP